jgi:hypothetical protein
MEEQQKIATQVTGCNKCKKGMSNTQWALLIFSLYMFGAGVYGTIQIVKDIVSLF